MQVGGKTGASYGRLGSLFASSSLTAIIIAGGAPAALAAPCLHQITAPFDNPAAHTIANVCVQNTSFTGHITNEGTISPSGIAFINSTLSGFIESTGVINGGISLDGTSRIDTTPFGILITGPILTGGISNAGRITAGSTAIAVEGVTSFAGGIVNNGALTVSGDAIFVQASTFSGGIANSGTVSAKGSGILAISGLTFTGGITNSGTISAAGGSGININSFSTFTGGITNTGTISAGSNGIQIFNNAGVATFENGITNTGTISAGADAFEIVVSTFTGGITNNGTVTAPNEFGIFLQVANFSGGISLGSSSKINADETAIQIGGPAIFSGGITNAGSITSIADDGINVSGRSFANGIANSGTISAQATGIAITSSTFTDGVTNSGTIAGRSGISADGVTTFTGGISNSGKISAGDNGIFVGFVSTFAGGIANSGTISGFGGISVGSVSTFAGGISNNGAIIANTGIFISVNVTFAAGSAIVNTGTIIGTGGNAIDVAAATSPVTIDQVSGLLSGSVQLSANADVLNISGGGINGNIVGRGSSDTINFTLGSGTFTYGSAFGFSAINQVNVDSGTVILDGANSATSVTVAGGTLEIGDAASTGATLQAGNVAVNGGVLSGNGTIDPATVTINSGGTLAPGTPGGFGTLNIVGTLAFNAGSFYAITIAPSGSNSKTAVTGSATLGGNGTVEVTPQFGHYNAGTVYQILTTTGGLTGHFAGLTVNGGFTGTASLDYATNPGDVDLDIATAGNILLAPPAGMNQNQQNVFNGINNAILGGATVPQSFQILGNISGPSLLNALSQLSGEPATDASKGAGQLMNEFLDLMLDPTAGGGGGANGGAATGFAPEQDASLPSDIALAYTKALRKQPAPDGQPQSFDQRWSAWGSAFGGTSFTDGNAAIGSNNVTASDYGFAAGMDYHATPNVTYGFGLAGGGTNWTLAQGLGSGRSDAFQAGVYAKTHLGPAYLSGALAFANHWFTTDRIALGDQLQATFTGQSYAARLEGGYRYAVPITGAIVGVTPYAALQAQDFHTPSYSETDLTGGGFGLSYASMNATDTRSELGARFDNLQVIYNMPLVLRGRLAWAHDWVSNPALGAVFQTLPGSNFTVNGATAPKDSALTTAAAELHINTNWTAIAKFDGDFGSGSQTYGGTGALRYSW